MRHFYLAYGSIGGKLESFQFINLSIYRNELQPNYENAS